MYNIETMKYIFYTIKSCFEENCGINFLCICVILIRTSRNSGDTIFFDVCDTIRMCLSTFCV